MRRIVEQLSIYDRYHSKLITKIFHFIGVPLITFSILLFTGWIHIRVPNFFDTTLAWLLTVLVLIYYYTLDVIFAAALTVVFLILNMIASYFSQPAPTMHGFEIFLITFVIGWACQLIGHIFESKRPAFMSNIKQIIIAPLYLTAEVFFCFGYKKDIEEEIEQQNATTTI